MHLPSRLLFLSALPHAASGSTLPIPEHRRLHVYKDNLFCNYVLMGMWARHLWHPEEGIGHRTPWSQRYRQWLASLCRCWFLCRSSNIYNCWAVSPAPGVCTHSCRFPSLALSLLFLFEGLRGPSHSVLCKFIPKCFVLSDAVTDRVCNRVLICWFFTALLCWVCVSAGHLWIGAVCCFYSLEAFISLSCLIALAV